MKIDVTYEKKDILRLVQKDMEAQGIRAKAGIPLEYKGALQVKFSVETEDDVIVSDLPEVVSAAPVVSKVTEEESMANVLGMSQQLSARPGKFERRLANNELMQESYEFPKES